MAVTTCPDPELVGGAALQACLLVRRHVPLGVGHDPPGAVAALLVDPVENDVLLVDGSRPGPVKCDAFLAGSRCQGVGAGTGGQAVVLTETSANSRYSIRYGLPSPRAATRNA